RPRGYRLLGKVPRMSAAAIDSVIERFGDLQKILRASVSDLNAIDGISGRRAQTIKESLARIAETSILDRFS
ncbi:MAG: DNA integrity scanning diadenylate cyclase DisA, partial [Acidimicrobiales bacterium]